MIRSMMFFKNVKLMFWGDAVKCAAYLRNRSPSNALDNKTPNEMWFGHLPSIRHLRFFGSTCYALIPKRKETSLVLEAENAFSLGTKKTPRHTICM